MGIYINGDRLGGGYVDSNKIGGMAYNGEVIYRAKKPLKIVMFADGTDEEIGAMLEAHYNGIINIGDYWKVGDTRAIHLNAMNATTGGEAHAAQNITMVIIGIEHDNLVTPINGKTKAAITLQCKEV